MSKLSAGILIYRGSGPQLEVLLVHPGGPYYTNKDLGVWSIPKGGPHDGETLLHAAYRELSEETGFAVQGTELPLGSVKQKGGKTVHCFAIEGSVDPTTLQSDTFEMTWPPRSGEKQHFPEVDEARWFTLDEARVKIHAAQAEFLDRLTRFLETNQI